MIDGNSLRRNPTFKKRRIEISLTTGLLLRPVTVISNSHEEKAFWQTPWIKDSPTTYAKIEATGVNTVTNTAVLPPIYDDELKFTLTEVFSCDIHTTATTGTYSGAISNVIQPWYFQPISIEISGKSYMGAFDNDTLNVGVDNDVANLILLRDKINQDFIRSDVADRLKVKISITNEPSSKRADNRAVKQEFYGIVNELRIRESEDNPYTQEYNIRFLGEYADRYAMNKGFEGLRQDYLAARNFKTSSVTTTSVVPKKVTSSKLITTNLYSAKEPALPAVK